MSEDTSIVTPALSASVEDLFSLGTLILSSSFTSLERSGTCLGVLLLFFEHSFLLALAGEAKSSKGGTMEASAVYLFDLVFFLEDRGRSSSDISFVVECLRFFGDTADATYRSAQGFQSMAGFLSQELVLVLQEGSFLIAWTVFWKVLPLLA